jgi:hypothetical protein
LCEWHSWNHLCSQNGGWQDWSVAGNVN